MVKENLVEKRICSIYRLFLLILSILILIESVYPLGVSPAVTNINFESGRVKQVTLDIINNEDKEITAKIYVGGFLAKYMTLNEDEIKFMGAGQKKITFQINLPESMDTPGLHGSEIKIQEIQELEEKESINIRPNLGLIHQVFVHVPYPYKYAEAGIKTTNVKRGDDIQFFIKIMNLGEEDIKKAYSKLDIYDINGKLKQSIVTEEKDIKSKKVGELLVRLNSEGFIPGDYYVNATVYYDDIPIYLGSRFNIDDFLIDLLLISVDDYKIGQIAKFTILTQNIGNKIVKDFRSRLELRDIRNEIVANINSFNIDIQAGEVKETVAYWDTRDITIGDYTGIISLQYEKEVMEKKIKTTVLADEIKVEVIGITAMAIHDSPESITSERKGSPNFQLSLIILLLAIIAGILIFRTARKRKD